MEVCLSFTRLPSSGRTMKLPNGKVGRPGRVAKTKTEKSQDAPTVKAEQEIDIEALVLRLSKMEETLLMLSKEIHGIKEEVSRIITGI